jgi:membrane-associated protease RseP (regulator of RpoE activity)
MLLASSVQYSLDLQTSVSTHPPDPAVETFPVPLDWRTLPPRDDFYLPDFPHPSVKSLILAMGLFFLTFATCLVAGTQFAAAYANHQAASVDEFVRAFTLFFRNPAGLLVGLPFALTLLLILLAHELGHFFACRRHHIHSTYPFFIPFPSLIGTFGAFILIRSPIRTTRALFDVGASGPIVGFLFAVPALIYGVLHSAVVPALAHPDPAQTDMIFGAPILLRLLNAVFHPGVNPQTLLLPPIGRAAWVGLFATSLNLLPTGQLDGGHILRSVSPWLHRLLSWLLPAGLVALGYFGHWPGWYIWAALLLGIRFLRPQPIYDPAPLDPPRQLLALFTLVIFVLSFMPAPISGV